MSGFREIRPPISVTVAIEFKYSAPELFRNQEDPLGDRLEGLQPQAMVATARAIHANERAAAWTGSSTRSAWRRAATIG